MSCFTDCTKHASASALIHREQTLYWIFTQRKLSSIHRNKPIVTYTCIGPWNVKPYFTLLDILKLENVFKLKIGTLVHKLQCRNKDTPPALYDLAQPASAVHQYNTRYAFNQNLHRPFSRTNYGLARFCVMASQIWETIPMKIKCLAFNSFKNEYKLFLLESQACWKTLINYLTLFI